MPQYSYTARNRDGQVVTDTVIAPSREAVGQLLRQQGLLPTSILERRTLFGNFRLSIPRLFARVSLLEKLIFINNLAVTIKAGLPVSRALGVLTKQMPNPYFRNVVGAIAHGVETGKSLSESMEAYPKVFPPLLVNMVRVGEQSGELDKNLEYLGIQMARDYNLVRRTRGALIYPTVVAGVLVVIGYLMFTFVLPKLTASFTELGADLPLLTRVIIKAVDILSSYSVIVILVIIGLGLAFWFWQKTPGGVATIHKLILNLPVVGKIVKKLNLARFTIIFSGLLRSGMPIVEALKITGETMSNLYYKEALVQASEKVKIGVDLVVALERYPKLFTPMVTQMIQVGEESGTMEKVLAEVSNFYETEIDDTVKNLSSLIEPLLVIIIGAVVGVLAVGLILPIYNIGQNI